MVAPLVVIFVLLVWPVPVAGITIAVDALVSRRRARALAATSGPARLAARRAAVSAA